MALKSSPSEVACATTSPLTAWMSGVPAPSPSTQWPAREFWSFMCPNLSNVDWADSQTARAAKRNTDGADFTEGRGWVPTSSCNSVFRAAATPAAAYPLTSTSSCEPTLRVPRFPVRFLALALTLASSAAYAPRDSTAVESKNGLVVSVSAPASDAGAAILDQGGNAVDAAVGPAFSPAVQH